MKKKLANSLNVLYQDIVNKKAVADVDSPKYIEAKNFVETYYPKLNEGVLEFLAMYMCVHQKGTIEFFPSEKSAVDLFCSYSDVNRLISYAENGVIVKDQTSAKSSSQKGE